MSRPEVVYGHTDRAPVFKVHCGQSVLALERRRSKTANTLAAALGSRSRLKREFVLWRRVLTLVVALSRKHVYAAYFVY